MNDKPSTLTSEIVAQIWREHSNCNWTSTGVNVMWSCGIWHPGPLYMQPTTRGGHVAALVMTQVTAEVAQARAEGAAEAWERVESLLVKWRLDRVGFPLDDPRASAAFAAETLNLAADRALAREREYQRLAGALRATRRAAPWSAADGHVLRIIADALVETGVTIVPVSLADLDEAAP